MQSLFYNKIKEIGKYGFNFQLPEVYQIEATNKCNFKCNFCNRLYVDRHEGFLNPELIDIMGSRGDFDNSYYIELQMAGEPLLHPGLGNVIDKLKKYNLSVGLSTNGSLIPKKLDDLSNLDYITISMDSSEKQDYEAKRSGGSFSELLFNINLLRKTYPSLKIDLQVINLDSRTREHIQAINKVYSGDKNIVVRCVEDCFITHRNNISDAECRALCFNSWMSVSVLWDGRVVPCCFDFGGEYVYGDLYESSLKDIWVDKAVKDMRFSHFIQDYYPLCKKCYVRSPALLHFKMVMDRLKGGKW